MSGLNRYCMTLGCLLTAALLIGCAGPWAAAPGRLDRTDWQVTPPPGWMHLETANGDMFSQDGPYLSYLLIQARSLTTPFHYTRRILRADMLPHEAARLISDNLALDPHIRGFELLESRPATLAGHAGFVLTYQYLDPHGVRVKTIYYGVILKDRFFNLRYTAASRCYFDKDRPVLTAVIDTLRLSD